MSPLRQRPCLKAEPGQLYAILEDCKKLVNVRRRCQLLCRFTGFTQGLSETFARTPAICQQLARQPPEGDFLHTVHKLPLPKPERDPCNFSNTHKRSSECPVLWPPLQEKGRQDSCKPPRSHIELGDPRIKPFMTSYCHNYAAPLPGGAAIRSPLQNESLSQTADLAEQYRFALQRVGEKQLKAIMAHMRERMYGKVGNKSDNAFRLRKFARMYDKDQTGYIGLEDFRVATEAGGMQLDDDSLLALFSKYDSRAEGRVRYLEVMKDILDEDAYALFSAGADINSEPTFSQTFRRC